jgi:hypothetical protein
MQRIHQRTHRRNRTRYTYVYDYVYEYVDEYVASGEVTIPHLLIYSLQTYMSCVRIRLHRRISHITRKALFVLLQRIYKEHFQGDRGYAREETWERHLRSSLRLHSSLRRCLHQREAYLLSRSAIASFSRAVLEISCS